MAWYVKCRARGTTGRYRWLGERKIVSRREYAFGHSSKRRAFSFAGIMLILNSQHYVFKVVRHE